MYDFVVVLCVHIPSILFYNLFSFRIRDYSDENFNLKKYKQQIVLRVVSYLYTLIVFQVRKMENSPKNEIVLNKPIVRLVQVVGNSCKLTIFFHVWRVANA